LGVTDRGRAEGGGGGFVQCDLINTTNTPKGTKRTSLTWSSAIAAKNSSAKDDDDDDDDDDDGALVMASIFYRAVSKPD